MTHSTISRPTNSQPATALNQIAVYAAQQGPAGVTTLNRPTGSEGFRGRTYYAPGAQPGAPVQTRNMVQRVSIMQTLPIEVQQKLSTYQGLFATIFLNLDSKTKKYFMQLLTLAKVQTIESLETVAAMFTANNKFASSANQNLKNANESLYNQFVEFLASTIVNAQESAAQQIPNLTAAQRRQLG